MTAFTIPDGALGDKGRKVRCARCEHRWVATSADVRTQIVRPAPPPTERPLYPEDIPLGEDMRGQGQSLRSSIAAQGYGAPTAEYDAGVSPRGDARPDAFAPDADYGPSPEPLGGAAMRPSFVDDMVDDDMTDGDDSDMSAFKPTFDLAGADGAADDDSSVFSDFDDMDGADDAGASSDADDVLARLSSGEGLLDVGGDDGTGPGEGGTGNGAEDGDDIDGFLKDFLNKDGTPREGFSLSAFLPSFGRSGGGLNVAWVPKALWGLLVIIWMGVIGAFIFGEEMVTSAWPKSAIIFAAKEGMSDAERFREGVDPDAKSIIDEVPVLEAGVTNYRFEDRDGRETLIIEGRIDNNGTISATVPRLKGMLLDQGGRVLREWEFDPEGQILSRGGRITFTQSVYPVPGRLALVAVQIIEGTRSNTPAPLQ